MSRSWDREELAWAGGYFEGEGCLTTRTNGTERRYPGTRLSTSDEDGVRRFQDAVGFGSVYFSPRRKPHYKDMWVWNVTSYEKTQALVAMLWPWLGGRRRERAAEILQPRARSYRKVA